MSTLPGPYELEATRLILGPEGNATPKPVTDTFYQELGSDFGSFAGHILISKFDFAEAWPSWEMHPKGDEFVYLLSGDVDFVLWVDGAEKTVHVNQPGCYVVVPKGIWHTARPRTPTSMLFVTPGQDTDHAETPPIG